LTASVEHYVSARQGLTLPGSGLAWLDALRDAGSRSFRQSGFPTLKDENWRYTNIRPILKQPFTPVAATADAPGSQEIAKYTLPELHSHRIVFVDGRYAPALSDLDHLPQGITVESMADAVTSGLDGVEEWLGKCMPEEFGGFTALNTAFIEDGLYLHVARDHSIELPVEVIFFNTAAGGQLVQPRNLYIVGENSHVHIIERYVSAGGTHLTNPVTELVARGSAVVEHTRMQEEDAGAFHVGGVFVRLNGDSRVISNNMALGSMIARTDLNVVLAGEGACCELNGMYLGSGRQHIDNFTQVDHLVPNCKSDELYKGVLNDRSRAVFHGRVVVHQDAQHTDARQQNRNLLLSGNAEVDTKPQLEIYADDVKCSHGATVGQLDEDAMYYMRTRGVDATTARSLLTWAFAADVISRVSSRPVRNHIEGVLGHKLFGVDRLEDLV
jgi:Fe-S cluster assembly protein SufD